VLGNDTVKAALADPDAADLPVKVKAMLRLITKVTTDHGALTAEDMTPVLDAGVTRDGVLEALAVAWAFNIITRLADAFEFEVGPPAAFEAGAKMLLTRGYK
jgi:alkylhydroperoxidase family enzyme